MSNDKKIPPVTNQEMDSEISAEERALMDESMENSISEDNDNLKRTVLDNADEEGDLLNGESGRHVLTGDGLDVPGSELDDANEDIGAEDEENNSYSQADTE
jgi:hypothetical protein